MAEDFDDRRWIFNRGDDLQSAAAVRAVLDVDLSGANAVLESLSDWHRKLIEIGRAHWGFKAAAA